MEEKYDRLYAPLYDKRTDVVNGKVEAPENETGKVMQLCRQHFWASCAWLFGIAAMVTAWRLQMAAAIAVALFRIMHACITRCSLPLRTSACAAEGKAAAAEELEDVPAGVPDFWMIALRNAMEEETVGDGLRTGISDWRRLDTSIWFEQMLQILNLGFLSLCGSSSLQRRLCCAQPLPLTAMPLPSCSPTFRSPTRMLRCCPSAQMCGVSSSTAKERRRVTG